MRTIIPILILSALPANARAGNIEYNITDLGLLAGSPSNGGSFPAAMNNLGQAVGYGVTYTDYGHAFLYTGAGSLINLGSLAGDYSVSAATGINDQSTVVGYTDTPGPGNPTHAFLYTQASGMEDLGALSSGSSSFSQATGINNSGQIIGISTTGTTGGAAGFIYNGNGPMVSLGSYQPTCINNDGLVAATVTPGTQAIAYVSSAGTGTWMNIGSLGGTYTVPYGINESGEIVGTSATSTASKGGQPFVYSGGTMTDLGTFGGQYGMARSVNDFGVVVGSADFPGEATDAAFVYYGSGAIENLNDLLVSNSGGWNIGGAGAVNDSGQILAEAYEPGGPDHAILLTPTPEPSSLCLVLAASVPILAIALWRRRKEKKRCQEPIP